MKPIPCFISKLQTMSDKGIRIIADTQEITDPETKQEIFGIHDKAGFFYFKEVDFTPDDIEVPDIPIQRDEKSPSQRLRAVLYLLWNQSKTTLGYEQYYREQVDKIIEKLKEKLDG